MDIYVGNLSFKLDDGQLQGLFESYGEVVSARIITDRETGRSRGFGFVKMADRGDAEKAIEALNGTENQGRTLVVNEARPSQPKPRGPRPMR